MVQKERDDQLLMAENEKQEALHLAANEKGTLLDKLNKAHGEVENAHVEIDRIKRDAFSRAEQDKVLAGLPQFSLNSINTYLREEVMRIKEMIT